MALGARSVALGAGGLAYIVGSQWLMTRTPPSAWSAVALLGPMLALLAAGARRSGRRGWALVAVATIGLLAVQAASGRGLAPAHLYLLQHVAIHAVLALVFGASLRPGARPLIARLAERVHHTLTPAMERYIRKVTLAWTVYFSAIALVSIALYLAAPFALWAAFANLVTPVALALMFAGEYLLRYRLHPEFERVSLQAAIRAYTEAPPRAERAAPAPPP